MKFTASALSVFVSIVFLFPGTIHAQDNSRLKKKWKILHIMSYHSPWKWTDDQFNGFKSSLKGMDITYKVYQMDGKRKTSDNDKELAGKQARNLIESWKPDLVYTTDDNAQDQVTRFYINSDIPFVFSGVNLNPYKYGFLGAKNITGIMEQEHFSQTVNLLQQIVPGVKKIAVIFDKGSTWQGVGERMLTKLPHIKTVQVTSWNVINTFREYKDRVKALQTQVDAIALLGIFMFKDENADSVPYIDVLKWTAENSRLPDFSFWKDRIFYGTLCTVSVSGYEQGVAAGRLARSILEQGVSPGSLAIRPSLKGEPVISLARARKLGINIKANVLLSADVITDFKWE